MTLFRHDFFELPKIERLDKMEGKRFYRLPFHDSFIEVPSVTTLLDEMPASPELIAWRKRMGSGADRYTKMIAARGTNLHTICERYLRNEENPTRGMMPDVKAMFAGMKPHLNNIGVVRGIECQVFSIKHRYAGTIDLTSSWKDIDSAIVDFKNTNSDHETNAEKAKKYFLQLAAYGIAVEELTGIPTNYGVVIFGSNDHGSKVFESDLTEYKEKFIDFRNSISF